MNEWKTTITLLACCCIFGSVSPTASADFVGVTTVIQDDGLDDSVQKRDDSAVDAVPLIRCSASILPPLHTAPPQTQEARTVREVRIRPAGIEGSVSGVWGHDQDVAPPMSES